jgi:hypothetical protein
MYWNFVAIDGVKKNQLFIYMATSPLSSRHMWVDFLENVTASTPDIAMGLHCLLQS